MSSYNERIEHVGDYQRMSQLLVSKVDACLPLVNQVLGKLRRLTGEPTVPTKSF